MPKNWLDFRYTSADGLRLAGRKYGWENEDANPVVCLAGLTRNSSDFHELATFLRGDEGGSRRVLCLDYRGRGESEYDRNWQNYVPLVELDDALQGIIAAGLDHVHLIGTSLGGIISMLIMAVRPGIVKSVVLNDIGPEIDGRGLVRIRNFIEKSQDPRNMDEAAQLLKLYSGNDFPNVTDEGWMEQAELAYKEENGKLVRRHDKKLLKTLRDINMDARLPDMWPQFLALKNVPTLLLRGQNSILLTAECAERMKQELPHMHMVEVPDQGHAPDLGTANLPQTIGRFLSQA